MTCYFEFFKWHGKVGFIHTYTHTYVMYAIYSCKVWFEIFRTSQQGWVYTYICTYIYKYKINAHIKYGLQSYEWYGKIFVL